MEHKFPLGSFHRENGTTFSGIPFFPEIFQSDEPTNHVPFTTQPEFPEFLGKWKTPPDTRACSQAKSRSIHSQPPSEGNLSNTWVSVKMRENLSPILHENVQEVFSLYEI